MSIYKTKISQTTATVRRNSLQVMEGTTGLSGIWPKKMLKVAKTDPTS